MRWLPAVLLVGCAMQSGESGKTAHDADNERLAREKEAGRTQQEQRDRERSEKAADEEQRYQAQVAARRQRMEESRQGRAKADEESQDRERRSTAAERDRLRESCAADREMRARMRESNERDRAEREAKREAAGKAAAYRASHCQKIEHGIETRTGRTCVDEDGYFYACSGYGAAEVAYKCPDDGPPGARGIVVMGVRRANQDPSRVARLGSTSRSRDEECAEFDREAAP